MMKLRHGILPKLVLSSLIYGVQVWAATITVSNNSNSGAGSLRDAVNAAAPGDTIRFANPLGAGQTISLLSEISIPVDVTITAAGGPVVSIGNSQGRVFKFESLQPRTVTLENLSLQGSMNSFGGAIYAGVLAVNLTINNSTVSGVSCNGGGIYIGTGSSLTMNGGAVQNSQATSSILCGLLSGRGGGLLVEGGAATLINTTFSNNTAVGHGGAIDSATSATTLSGVTISGNSSGGSGGGVHVSRAIAGLPSTMSINQSTLSGNTASGNGGGISVQGGALTMTNCTIANNTAANGGGVDSSTLAGFNGTTSSTLTNCTIAGNLAGATPSAIYARLNTLLIPALDTVTLINTIVAGSVTRTQGTGATNSNLVINATHSLFDSTPTTGSGNTLNGTNVVNQFGTNPNLGALQNNGGSTPTMALLPNGGANPAFGQGASGVGIPAIDQRGMTRRPTPDIGAFEIQRPAMGAPVTINSTSFSVSNVTLASFTGFGNSAASFNAFINWGDATSSAGTVVVNNPGAVQGTLAGIVQGSHTYAGDGNYSVQVTITDSELLSNSVTSTVNIIVAPPTIAKSFLPVGVTLNVTSTLTFTIANPASNTTALTGIGFTDNLPAGLVVGTPNGLTGGCGGGTITAVSGSSTVSLSGATLASGSCTFSVTVLGTSLGAKINSTGPVVANGTPAGAAACAILTVFAAGSGLTLHPQGGALVVRNSAGKVVYFDGNYSKKYSFGNPGSGPGQFSGPNGVRIAANGYVLVSDTGNSRVVNFDSNLAFKYNTGGPGTGTGQFEFPAGIAVMANGNVVVVDTSNNRVQVFDNANNFKFRFGAAGAGKGQFSAPSGVTILGNGNIAVADTGNHRIQVFDAVGTFLFQFGTLGAGNGQFFQPAGLTTDAAGNILVADMGNNRIQLFDSNANFRFKFGSAGSGNGQFASPTAVVVMPGSGDIWVLDEGNNRIEVFDKNAIFKLKFPATP